MRISNWSSDVCSADLEVYAGIARRPGVRYPVLVPNERGYDRAREAGADEIAVFTAASEAFNKPNTNATIDQSLARFAPELEPAQADGMPVRCYFSTLLGSPYHGDGPVTDVVRFPCALPAFGSYAIPTGPHIASLPAGTAPAIHPAAARGVA